MKIKISKLPFITFLSISFKHICYTVFVTWCRIYLKISTEPNPKKSYSKTCYVNRRDQHTATKISEHIHTFWYVLPSVRIKDPGPLRF